MPSTARQTPSAHMSIPIPGVQWLSESGTVGAQPVRPDPWSVRNPANMIAPPAR